MVKNFIKERLGTIIFIGIVAVMLIIGSFSIKKARENAINYSNEYEAPEATANLLDDGEYVSIANNGKLELLYNDVKGAIQVTDLASGHLWKGIADEEVYSKMAKSNKQWQANMMSSIHIKYNDLKKRDSGVKELYAAKDCGFLESEMIENGVAVTYGFLTPGIYVRVEYTIEDDELVVRIPYTKIREESRYAITTISVLPYLGACENNNEGYLFYPDGSGAITTFERVYERATNVKMATYYTYSNKSVAVSNYTEEDIYNRYTACMPVLGIKDGDYAVFGYVSEGSGNSAINVYPSGVSVDLNRISFDVFVRNVYNVNMYNVSASKDSMATGGTVQRVDKTLIPEDKEIRYRFLSGDKANYSGMAEAYRDYLIENAILGQTTEADNTALALKILMGTVKEGIVFDEYIAMTTYEQVIDILEELEAKGIGKTDLILEAWQKNSENYNYWGPDSHLGGTAGLRKLSEYLEAHSNVKAFLETDLVVANSDTKGLDKEKDVAYNGLNLEIAREEVDGGYTYMKNPYAVANDNETLLKKLSKYDLLGIAYNDLGKYAYADFNIWHPYTKDEATAELAGALAKTAENNREIAVNGSNQYALANTDYIYNLREESFGLSITDYSVPFVQLVISGRISYSSDAPGNLSYDLQTQKLKWIEFGSKPYFYLTYESALNLRDTDNDTLFSSTFADWLPKVVDTCNEFRTTLSCIDDVRMVEHTVLSKDVRKVTYENGTVIYVNYGDKEAIAEGVTIPAKNYVVTGGER